MSVQREMSGARPRPGARANLLAHGCYAMTCVWVPQFDSVRVNDIWAHFARGGTETAPLHAGKSEAARMSEAMNELQERELCLGK